MTQSSEPLVSVIIPFYNAHQHLRETVQSVLAQKYSNFEIIIVNDGSKPPTIREVLQGLDLSKVEVVDHLVNKGLATTRNTGILAAKSDLLLPLDADDLITPDCIEKMVKHLQANSDVAAVYSRVQIFGDVNLEWIPDASMFSLMCGIPIQSTLLFKREVFEKVNGYNSSIKRSPDVDFWLRVLHSGFKLSCIDEILYHYRKYSGSLSDEGKLTEVEDLARANMPIFLENIDQVYEVENQKFQNVMEELAIIKSGFNQMYLGYLDLQKRYADVRTQLLKRKKSCPDEGEIFEISAQLELALKTDFECNLGTVSNEDLESDRWLQKLVLVEKDYFRAKANYSIIEKEFTQLKTIYQNLHKLFDQMVERLQQLGIRYQLNRLLGRSN